jgi:hypothetical protein
VNHTDTKPDYTAALRALDFSYPHKQATKLPSKLTATQLKGRMLDAEADDGRAGKQLAVGKLRQPSLTQIFILVH